MAASYLGKDRSRRTVIHYRASCEARQERDNRSWSPCRVAGGFSHHSHSASREDAVHSETIGLPCSHPPSRPRRLFRPVKMGKSGVLCRVSAWRQVHRLAAVRRTAQFSELAAKHVHGTLSQSPCPCLPECWQDAASSLPCLASTGELRKAPIPHGDESSAVCNFATLYCILHLWK